MLKFLKEKIFGNKITGRTGSVDVTSKLKKEITHKKPHSIDSKGKDNNIKTATKKPTFEQLDQFVDIESVKDISLASIRDGEEAGLEDLKNIIVSDQRSEEESYENLLSSIGQDVQQGQINPQTSIPKGKQIFPNFIDYPAILKKPQAQIHFQQQKILIKKFNAKKEIKRVQEICAVCKLPLKKAQSLQLACTHRYHKACGIKMQWKMHYKCDLCSSRNEKMLIKGK